MTVIWPTEETAFRRVETIKSTYGAWPGVVRCGTGWALTYDPAVTAADLAAVTA